MPSSRSPYRVAMTSSRPRRSASGRTTSSGVVVASTTSRPAAWCSSMSGRAKGCTMRVRSVGGELAGLLGGGPRPAGGEAGGVAGGGHGQAVLAEELEEPEERALSPGMLRSPSSPTCWSAFGDHRPRPAPQQRAVEVEERRGPPCRVGCLGARLRHRPPNVHRGKEEPPGGGSRALHGRESGRGAACSPTGSSGRRGDSASLGVCASSKRSRAQSVQQFPDGCHHWQRWSV